MSRSVYRQKQVAVFLAPLVMAGCVVGSDYTEPAPPLPTVWSTTEKAPTAVDLSHLAEWWTLFNDPTLDALIRKTIEGNPDRDRALARIREARARFQVAKADTGPTISAGTSANAIESADFFGDIDWRGSYDVGVDASWELDLFGGIKRGIEVAEATLQARDADYVDVMTSLVAEVALTYVDLQTQQARLRLTLQSVAAQEDTFQLTSWRAEVGVTTMLDFEQARSNLESTRAQIPLIERDLSITQNTLSFLAGYPPGGLDALLHKAVDIPRPPTDITIGVPANALRQRGDIRSAERNLAAQSARIGLAEANRYPNLRLAGSIGASASDVPGLFDDVSRITSFGPSLTVPVFNAGRLEANVAVEHALYQQAIANYEQLVLNALRETEDAIAARLAARARIETLEIAAAAAERAKHLATHEYNAGLTNFDRVLDAQRNLLSAQEQVVVNRSGELQAVISIFKAVGGGWAAATIDLPEENAS